jgi:DNA-binding transcriptional ArsR family regulator
MSASITLPTKITVHRAETATRTMQTKQVLTILSALAQESRLAVYRLLIEHAPDGLAASAIAEKLGLPNATLSFHLKELSHAGLVTSQQSGRFIYYAPVIEAMNDLIGYLTDHCCSQTDGSCGVGKSSCKPLGAAHAPSRKRRTSSL